jgi:site-specific recombinase XerD
MQLLDALDRFVMQLQADGRSSHTIGNYKRHIALLDGWLRETRRERALDAIGHEVLAAFLVSACARASAHGGAKSSASMNSLRTSLRVFFAWVHEAGYARVNAARLVRRAICSPPPPKALADADVERLLAALIVAQGPVARRDHLLIDLLLSTGMRIGSALALDVEDIDIATGTLTLRECKYDRVERVFFGRDIRDHLIGYLARKPRTGPLFRGPQGERLGKRSAQKRVAMWMQRADVEGTVHGLRHTFATRLYAKTGDVLLVRAALRHRSIASTLVYAEADETRLRAAVTK